MAKIAKLFNNLFTRWHRSMIYNDKWIVYKDVSIL